MAEVIILSDDDFSPQKRIDKHTSSSRHSKEKTAKEWNKIFSHKSHRERRHHDSGSHRSSHQSSSKHPSHRSPEKSSKHCSHRTSEHRSHHQSSSREDKERWRKKQLSSDSIVELDASDEEFSERKSSKTNSQKSSSGRSSRESSHHHHSEKNPRHFDKKSGSSRESSHHRHSDKTSRHAEKNSRHSDKHSSKGPSERSPSTVVSKPSVKSSPEKNSSAEPAVTANGRHSGSRRSLAAELGVSRANCRREGDGRRITNGEHAKAGAEGTDSVPSSQAKRPADVDQEAVPTAKRARVELRRIDLESVSDCSSAAVSEPKPEPKTEQKLEPEPEPCQQSLEEVCTLLKPLLSGPELKLVAKVRRRHAAVLQLAGGRSGRKQHLTGVTQQCAARLRTEPERCFTVLRGFLEQLEQIKIVAASAQSRTGPSAPSAAPGKDKDEGAASVARAKAKTAAVSTKMATEKTACKAATSDARKPSQPPLATLNGSAPSAPASERDEKEARRHRRHVLKLEKTLRRLEREIVRQDEQEVDWEDATGSSYIVGARLKRRYVQVYRYYCQLVGAGEEAQRLYSRRIRFDGTPYPEINRRIEKFVNHTREFPDFKDVLSLIKTANKRDRLRLGPGALHDQAKEAFLQLGNLLQKRRRAALAESMDSLAGAEEWRGRDPASGDPTLRGRLTENAASGSERMNEVFKEFVQRQETAAAERRQQRGDGADEDEQEESGEDEEAEESEVTDEELEHEQPRPPPVDDVPDSDASDGDDAASDAEMVEPEQRAVKETGTVGEEKEPRVASDVKTEAEVNGKENGKESEAANDVKCGGVSENGETSKGDSDSKAVKTEDRASSGVEKNGENGGKEMKRECEATDTKPGFVGEEESTRASDVKTEDAMSTGRGADESVGSGAGSGEKDIPRAKDVGRAQPNVKDDSTERKAADGCAVGRADRRPDGEPGERSKPDNVDKHSDGKAPGGLSGSASVTSSEAERGRESDSAHRAEKSNAVTVE